MRPFSLHENKSTSTKRCAYVTCGSHVFKNPISKKGSGRPIEMNLGLHVSLTSEVICDIKYNIVDSVVMIKPVLEM